MKPHSVNVYVLALLTAFAGAVFLGFLCTMLFFEGRANINAYGEGWSEVVLALVLFLLGAREIIRHPPLRKGR